MKPYISASNGQITSRRRHIVKRESSNVSSEFSIDKYSAGVQAAIRRFRSCNKYS